jgi:fluoroacetyl-CoA thioesterase
VPWYRRPALYGLGVAIELGMTGSADMIVEEADTAIMHGTGDVAVLSTSRLDALDGHLPEGMITAALRVNLDHLHGSYVGAHVSAKAVLTRIEGRRLVFEAEASNDGFVVGLGRIIRVQIDRETFLNRVL